MNCAHNIIVGLTVGFALAAFIVGLLAAHFWLDSTKVQIDPGFSTVTSDLRPIEPPKDEGHESQPYWTSAIVSASNQAAKLNKIAAQLTALAVVLATLSTLISAFGSCS